ARASKQVNEGRRSGASKLLCSRRVSKAAALCKFRACEKARTARRACENFSLEKLFVGDSRSCLIKTDKYREGHLSQGCERCPSTLNGIMPNNEKRVYPNRAIGSHRHYWHLGFDCDV